MNVHQALVQQFEKLVCGIEHPKTPTIPSPAVQRLRLDLHREENAELDAAFLAGDMVAVADALADLLYVVYGTANACGIDIEPIFLEIHRANMSKKGGERRADGKQLKPATYIPPNLPPLLTALGWKGE